MHRVIIDTDLGVDDSHAVLMALMSPEIKIEGFTTVYGNAKVEYCTQNLLYVLELLEKTDVPVRCGAQLPLMGEINFGKEHLQAKLNAALTRDGNGKVTSEYQYTSPHGEMGLGDFRLPEVRTVPSAGNAISWLVDTVLGSPGEIDILALGPLTNVALAILIEPQWAAAVRRIIFMGGALTVPGNVAPLSTANIAHDAEAAKIVFHAGCPIVMVGQDVTRTARLTPTHNAILQKTNTKVTNFLLDVTRYYAGYYFERQPSLIGKGHPIHDMLVVAYLLKPSLFKTEKLYVTVETHGEVTRGQTVADWREFSPHKPQMDVCVEVDTEALFDLYLDRVTQIVESKD